MGSSNDSPAVTRFQQRFVCYEACLSEFVSTLFDMNTGAGGAQGPSARQSMLVEASTLKGWRQ